jgi:hypothetical protein
VDQEYITANLASFPQISMKSDLILPAIKFMEQLEEHQLLPIKLQPMSIRVEATLESIKLELVLESIKREVHLEFIKVGLQVLIKL